MRLPFVALVALAALGCSANATPTKDPSTVAPRPVAPEKAPETETAGDGDGAELLSYDVGLYARHGGDKSGIIEHSAHGQTCDPWQSAVM